MSFTTAPQTFSDTETEEPAGAEATADEEGDEEDWQSIAKRYEGLLESIFGPEALSEWLTEGIALPVARADSPGTIVFEARVGKVSIQRSREGAKMGMGMVSDLAGAPVKELASLTEDDLVECRIAPLAYQQMLPEYPSATLPLGSTGTNGNGSSDEETTEDPEARRVSPSRNRRVRGGNRRVNPR